MFHPTYQGAWMARSRQITLIRYSTALIAVLSPSCAPKYDDLKVFSRPDEQKVAATTYKLAPPDSIAISSPTAAELDGEVQPIRSDGKISLKLLGEVDVVGLTPTELAHKLEQQLARYYVNPTVSVRVVSFESKRLYVFGHVGRQGFMPFTGRDTVLDVLSQARPVRGAWTANVKVIRPSAIEKERHEITVDVDRIMQAGDLKSNFLLQEGDIVYVPPTPFVWAGMQMQEVLFPVREAASAYNIPAQFMGATDYYQNKDTGRTYIRLSPSGGIPLTGFAQ